MANGKLTVTKIFKPTIRKLGNLKKKNLKKFEPFSAEAWGNGNFIVDFKSTNHEVSARCGGWCGTCAPENEIWLNPLGTWHRLNEPGQKVRKNLLLKGKLLKKTSILFKNQNIIIMPGYILFDSESSIQSK